MKLWLLNMFVIFFERCFVSVFFEMILFLFFKKSNNKLNFFLVSEMIFELIVMVLDSIFIISLLWVMVFELLNCFFLIIE